MDSQEKTPKFKLSKDTTIGISIGFIMSIALGAFAFGGTLQSIRSDVNSNRDAIIQLEDRVKATESVNTEVLIEVTKIRTQLDTLLVKVGD